MYVSAFLKFKSYNIAIRYIADIFSIKNNVLSVSDDNYYISAKINKNKYYLSESEIVNRKTYGEIKQIFFNKKPLNVKKNNDKIRKLIIKPKLNIDAKLAIIDSDIIIFGSGTLNSSLLPTLMTKNINGIINKSNAFKVIVTNILKDNDILSYDTNKLIDKIKATIDNKNNKNCIDLIIINKPKNKLNNYLCLKNKDLIKYKEVLIYDNFEDAKMNHNGNKLFNKIIQEYNNKKKQ